MLGDWDMSLPMISFTSSSVMSCRPMERNVGSLSSGSCLMFSLSPSEGKGPCGLRGWTRGPAATGDRLAMTGLVAWGEGCPECCPSGLPPDVGEDEVGDW